MEKLLYYNIGRVHVLARPQTGLDPSFDALRQGRTDFDKNKKGILLRGILDQELV